MPTPENHVGVEVTQRSKRARNIWMTHTSSGSFNSPVLAFFLLLQCCAASATSTITVRRGDTGEVYVNYKFSPGTKTAQFSQESTRRLEDWDVDRSKFEVETGSLRSVSGRAVSKVQVRITPDRRLVDREYPALISIDRNTSLVNLDYLTLSGERAVVELANAYNPDSHKCEVTYRLSQPETGERGQYVLLSDEYRNCVEHVSRAANVITSEDTPDTLVQLVSELATSTYGRLEARFGIPSSQRPTVVLSYDGSINRQGLRADVGWKSTILFQVRPGQIDPAERNDRVRVQIVLTHELAHLWLGKFAGVWAPNGVHADWLFEGAAEYIALLDSLSEGLLTGPQVRERIGASVDACIKQLGDRPLMSVRAPAAGQVIYDCGVTVQFAYDAAIRNATQRTLVELWRELLSRAYTERDQTIPIEWFVDSSQQARQALDSVLNGRGPNPTAIVDGFRSYGVDAVYDVVTDHAQQLMSLLEPFYRQDCRSGPWGFYLQDKYLLLDAPDTCKSVHTGFQLRHIAGLDVLELPADVLFQSMSRICQQQGEVAFSGIDETTPPVVLPCPQRSFEIPKAFSVRHTPFFGD
jgi:hypothetical protein